MVSRLLACRRSAGTGGADVVGSDVAGNMESNGIHWKSHELRMSLEHASISPLFLHQVCIYIYRDNEGASCTSQQPLK